MSTIVDVRRLKVNVLIVTCLLQMPNVDAPCSGNGKRFRTSELLLTSVIKN